LKNFDILVGFKNLSIKVKLISCLLIIAFIGTMVGIVRLIGINNMDNEMDEVASIRMPSIEYLLTIKEAQTALKVVERSLLIEELSPGERLNQYKMKQ
jgi:hypothetical protein